jgi:hypothetical protein
MGDVHATDDAEVAATLGPGGEPAGCELGPGARIGRYEVLGVLGRGGMGVVDAAWDDQLEREVKLRVGR